MSSLGALAPRMANLLRDLEQAGRDRDGDPCCPDCGRCAPVIIHTETCELGAVLRKLEQLEGANGDAFCSPASRVASITATRALSDDPEDHGPARQMLARRVIEQTCCLVSDLLGALAVEVDEGLVMSVARVLCAARNGGIEQAASVCDVGGLTKAAAMIRALKVEP